MSLSLKLGEVIVDAAIAKLNTGLAARIAAINTEKNDSVTIVAPVNIYPFGKPQGLLADFPAYVVTVYGESPVYEKEGAHGFIYSEGLAVMVAEQDPDRERIGRKLLRHQRAIIETLWDDQPREQLTNSAFTLEPVKHIPGPTFEPTDERPVYEAYFIQVFIARQLEGE
jgi:hypothetical protein